MTVGELKRVVSWLWHNEYENSIRLDIDKVVDKVGMHNKLKVDGSLLTGFMKDEIFRCNLMGANEEKRFEIIKAAMINDELWAKVWHFLLYAPNSEHVSFKTGRNYETVIHFELKVMDYEVQCLSTEDVTSNGLERLGKVIFAHPIAKKRAVFTKNIPKDIKYSNADFRGELLKEFASKIVRDRLKKEL